MVSSIIILALIFNQNQDETMMIEADVNLGYFTGGSIFDFIPIMAHPPIIYSDLSLDLFLDTVIEVSFFAVVALFSSVKKFYKYLY